MINITTLDDGLRIVTQNMPGLETVSMGIWNFVGGRDEKKEVNGVAHLLEHMAFKGTTSRNALQIAETIENVGGDINAYTSKEITAYYVKLIAEDLPLGIDILTDILQNSSFAEDELNRERGVILQEIGMYLDTPDDMIFDYWQEKAFPDQPMGRSILGKTEIIKNITRDQVKDFMQSHYNPNKMVVSAAGKINHDQFVEQIRKKCINLPLGNNVNRQEAKYFSGEYREQKDLEQIHLLLGFEGIDYHHDDYYSLLVYSSLLGGGMSSRLFQEIREKRGLVYGISSFSSSYTDTGMFGIYAGTGETQIAELIPVLCDELKNSPNSISEKEINRGKAQLKASLMMGRESAFRRCESAARQLLVFNRVIDPNETIKSINQVSKESVEKIAQQIVSGSMTISSIGPITKLESLDKIQKRLS
jgi:predicted Zn-dependent peptidase|tara:strand:- start:5190 stop:6443 length:1254 start_codon:yes stop_codon:yes gene_type:complete